jgi:hypothetical protein
VLTKREEAKAEEAFVQDMIYRIAAPTLCWPGYEEDITQEMKEKARIARLAKRGLDQECTDYEACLYLMTASQVAPFDRVWFKIYASLFAKAFPDKSKEIFRDPEQLESYEEQELHRFKQWIYKKQIEHMKQHEKRGSRRASSRNRKPRILHQVTHFW